MSFPELDMLGAFADSCGNLYYANGFELIEFNDEGIADTYSEDPVFVRSFVFFAQASSSGSLYASWRADDARDLAAQPVVAFGDEGGISVVASDFRDLLRQLGCDWSIQVYWGGANFCAPEPDDEPSPRHPAYIEWLADTFALTPPDDPNDLLQAAEVRFDARLNDWVDRYYQG